MAERSKALRSGRSPLCGRGAFMDGYSVRWRAPERSTGAALRCRLLCERWVDPTPDNICVRIAMAERSKAAEFRFGSPTLLGVGSKSHSGQYLRKNS
ncbi:hypothetical protein HNY73_011639, partial [Argiope bruennichi]